MVDIRRQDIEDFFRRGLGSFEVFLVCGSDAGLVAERCADIAKWFCTREASPPEIMKFDGDGFAANEGALIDEAQALSLFGDKRILWIRSGSKNFSKGVAALLKINSIENPVIIEAGQLKSDSPLKKLCLKSPRAAVVECWPDGPKEISTLIDDEFHRAGIKISSAGKALLLNTLGGDRLLSRSEIDKLILYCRGFDLIDATEVSAIVSDATSWSFDDLVFSAFEGGRASIAEKIQSALAHIDATALLSMALMHCLGLLDARIEIEQGVNRTQAAERFPRLFGPRRASIVNQLARWNSRQLLLQAQRLQDAISQTRKDPRLQVETVSRAYLNIAFSAPPPS